MKVRDRLKEKKRIVVKIGSSSLTHEETGRLNLMKMEILVRELADLHNQGKEVIVVSSGAIAVGRSAMGIDHKPKELAKRQACAAIGQARLMMIYQKLFAEYNQTAAQILMTKYTMINRATRINAKNTFDTLLEMGAIPIVNENDLKDALECGQLGGAGVDVLTTEPMSKNCPLYNVKNRVITPHIAWAALETRERLLKIVEENIKAFLSGNPQNVVNK